MNKIEELLAQEYHNKKLFNPGFLEAPYTETDIRSVNFLNLLCASEIFLLANCRSSDPNDYKAEAARLIKRIVWLRDATLMQSIFPGKQLPRFNLNKFRYYGMLRDLFPDRTPMQSMSILYYLALDNSDSEMIMRIMQDRLIFDVLHYPNDYPTRIKDDIAESPEKIQEKLKSNMLVYFMKCKMTGRIKIGKTKGDPRRRASEISTGSPGGVEILGVIWGDLENYYHKMFAKYKAQREWFEPHPELLEFIKDNAIPYEKRD